MVPFLLERFALSGNNNLLIRGEQDIEAMSDWQNKVDVCKNKLAVNEHGLHRLLPPTQLPGGKHFHFPHFSERFPRNGSGSALIW
jgi:hypothetical protein